LLVARRGERLQSLADELAKRHQVQCEVLSVDLASKDASATVMAH
jgi:short-subunit dehydrogenase